MLINLRNALMAGKRLPYDAEVEYLESTGTQYINSGLTVSNALRVKCRVSIEGVCWIFGGRTGGNNKQFSVYQQASTNIRFGYANTASDKTDSYGVHDIDFNQNAVYFDGALLHTFAASTFSSASPLYIGTLSVDEQGDPATQCLIGKIYSFQIWENNTLVRDYIPVRKGTVGYLYDRVSGKLFGNAGTGDFVLGQDVVPVEWLESSGSQYIDSGIIPQFPDELTLDAKVSFSDTYNRNIQGRQGFFYFGPCRGHLQPGLYSLNYVNDVVLSPDTWYNIQCTFAPTTVRANAPVYYNVDGITGSVTTQFDNTPVNGPVWLFTANNATNLRGQNKIARYNIYRSGTILRKFYAVRVGTEGAMMDVLTRRIYRNAGTGAFGYGNDLKYPIPAE